jgi:hypothetical protein
VELRALVALGLASGGFLRAHAEGEEVGGGLGDGVGEELDEDAAQGFAWGC